MGSRAPVGFAWGQANGRAGSLRRGMLPLGTVSLSPLTPPCGKPKNHGLVKLNDDIAPGIVSLQHPLKSDLREGGASPVLERIISAFDECELNEHILPRW
jgi:hypothetical protein